MSVISMKDKDVKTGNSRYSAPFNPGLVSRALKECMFGKNMIYRDTLGSTNVFLKNMALEGAPEGTVVVSDEQSAGLGRLGRQWISKKRENLLFSVLLRPNLPPERIFVLTMIFALAGIDAVEALSGLRAMIKWLNDIYVGVKKLGGILTEFAISHKVVQYTVLGMGLNVNWNPSREVTLLYPSSSIFSETGKKISREELLTLILSRFELFYQRVLGDKNDHDEFYRRWNERSAILGKQVVIETGNERVQGEAAGIDHDGMLTLITGEGHRRKFLCGDVSVKTNISERKIEYGDHSTQR